MDTRLIVASFSLLAFVACGSPASDEASDSSSQPWIINPKGGTIIPSTCEQLEGAEVPAMTHRIYAHSPTLTCTTISLQGGNRWVGTETLPGFTHYCTYDFVGTGAPDYQGLFQNLPADHHHDRAACGASVNGGNSSLFALEISPEGGISCGACQDVGRNANGDVKIVLPLELVSATAKKLWLMTAGGTHSLNIDLPAKTQVVSVPVTNMDHITPYTAPLYVSEGLAVPALAN